MKTRFIQQDRKLYARQILEALPEWFGQADAREQYIADVENLDMIVAQDRDSVIGFLSLKIHNNFSAEAYVLGIRPEYHGQGVGRMMFDRAEGYLAEKGFKYLSIKTLSEDHPDPYYARTRKFYEAIGFVPLEVFPDLWGAEMPCLMMVKALPRSGVR